MKHPVLALTSLRALLVVGLSADKWADEITSLPGLTFSYDSRQFSGWLRTPSRNLIHYWLLESQAVPSRDPLILFLQGGPGTSSLMAIFAEHGPFRVNPDGETLFENVANVLYFESPQSVGYSYRDPNAPANNSFGDNLTAEDNVDTLAAFLYRFPEYRTRDFYIAGESYSGIYIPTLAKLVIQRITAQFSPPHVRLRGLLIGNGILSVVQQTNSFVDLAFYRGIIGKTDFDFLKASCCANADNARSRQYCDYASYLTFKLDVAHQRWAAPIHNGDPTHDKCADLIYQVAQEDLFHLRGYNGQDTNQDCYTGDFRIPSFSSMMLGRSDAVVDHFVDQGSRVNIKSTDPFAGFPCYWMSALTTYLNLPQVRDATHVPKDVHINWTLGS